jgi:hypothetical protein
LSPVIPKFISDLAALLKQLAVDLGGVVTPPPIDPPPPVPPPVPDLEQALVKTDSSLTYTSTQGSSTAENQSKYNVSGKSWGLSLKMTLKENANTITPVNMTSYSGGQWIVGVINNGLLKVVVVRPGGGDITVDIPVDNLLNRMAHVVVGFDWTTKRLSVWVDRVLKAGADCPNGVGFSPTYTAPFRYNDNTSGFNKGSFVINEFKYYVGKTPTQTDVERLYGPDTVVAGFKVSLE